MNQRLEIILNLLAAGYLLSAVLWFLGGQPNWLVILSFAIAPAAFLIWRVQAQDQDQVDERLWRALGQPLKSRFRVHSKSLPSYRFVDLYRSVEVYVEGREDVVIVESECNEDLTSILHGTRQAWMSWSITAPTNVPWPVGPGEEAYYPVDHFWVCPTRSADARDLMILRVRLMPLQAQVVLEIAAEDAEVAEACITEILDRSSSASIFRNQVLDLGFTQAEMDEFGGVANAATIRVEFREREHVHDDDLIIDDEVRQTLHRNVIDLHEKRHSLKKHGVTLKRGVLLHGPPGTGKTFACRYLYSRLPDTTTIVVTGTALLQVKSIFNVARMLQPSLVILEDVDLIFSSREVNLYSTVLGDLLDQMDGLRPTEDVGFVLTTNAIERLEAAIKDRPGRVSQCIPFLSPNAGLRHRYLSRYLNEYDTSRIDMEHIVSATDGATQAFLKEWVYRSVQMAVERLAYPEDKVALENRDFEIALAEMRKSADASAGRIVGFSA